MKASEIINVINEIEESAPVEQWTVDGVHVWPLIRIQLGMDLFASGEVVIPHPSGTPRVWRRAVNRLKSYMTYMAASWTDRREEDVDFGEAQALFLSDGVSFTALEGKYYERFCDPLRSHLDSIGVRSLMLTPLDHFRIPRFSPSKFIQPQLDWIQIKRTIFWRNHSDNEYLPGFDLILEQLRKKTPAVAPEVARIRQHISLVIAFSRYFEDLLERVRPRICFLVSYYWLVGYGLLLACKRKGIPSVDIQHGVQGAMHFAYGGWSKVPLQGYELLPAYFWCWSQDEVAVIRKWTEGTKGAHQPVAGGNLFLNLWKSKVPSFVTRFDNVLLQKTCVLGTDKQVLVTLQPGLLTKDFIQILSAVIETTASGLQWWLRLHPGMLREREKVRDLFGRFAHVDIDAATDVPLYALLRHMAVHVTHSSSTVLEAREFGIKSVVCSRYGMELFAEQERDGVALYAETKEDLLSAIHKQRGLRSAMEQVAAQGVEQVKESHRLLQQLLADASRVGSIGK